MNFKYFTLIIILISFITSRRDCDIDNCSECRSGYPQICKICNENFLRFKAFRKVDQFKNDGTVNKNALRTYQCIEKQIVIAFLFTFGLVFFIGFFFIVISIRRWRLKRIYNKVGYGQYRTQESIVSLTEESEQSFNGSEMQFEKNLWENGKSYKNLNKEPLNPLRKEKLPKLSIAHDSDYQEDKKMKESDLDIL